MCGRAVRNILLLPLVARCLYTIDVCIERTFVCLLYDCGNVCCVAAVVEHRIYF